MPKIINSKFYILALIIIIAAFLRLYNITGLPPGLYPDEAMNGNNALEALSPTGHFKVFYPENNGREGLFINIQALSLKIFGNEPWALRVVSAIFGILTVLGVYFLTKELLQTSKFQKPNSKLQINTNDQNSNSQNLFGIWDLFRNSDLGFGISRSEAIALLSSFLLATSFWHINFSRIGFRAIMAPFFITWALYFLLNSLKAKSYKLKAILGGIFFGLGFYSYIAYRIMPLLIVIVFILYWFRKPEIRKYLLLATCYFLLATFVVALPIGLYFLNNPADFFGRTSEVSIFKSPTTLRDLGWNILKTAGMFNIVGDFNWRHNYAGAPELFWPVGVMFIIGVILGINCLLKNPKSEILNSKQNPNSKYQNLNQVLIPHFSSLILFSWLILAALPVVISNEGIPHALRSVLMIPPVFILAGVGGIWLYGKLLEKTDGYPKPRKTLLIAACCLILVLIVFESHITYFIAWGKNPNTQDAFAAHYAEIGRDLNELPKSLPKYVIVEANGVDVRGIPMPAQTVMFLTDTFALEKQKGKNIFYVLPKNKDKIPTGAYTVTIK